MKRFQIETETEVLEESIQSKALLRVKAFKDQNEPLIRLLDRKELVITTYNKRRYDKNYLVVQSRVVQEPIPEANEEQPPVEMDPTQEKE